MTKRDLQNYRIQRHEREHIGDLIEALEAEMYTPKIQQLSGMPHTSSSDQDAVAALVARRMQLLELYGRQTRELLDAQLRIEACIRQLPSNERELIRRRYIVGERWEDICADMAYSWRQIHRMHAAILKKLEKQG